MKIRILILTILAMCLLWGFSENVFAENAKNEFKNRADELTADFEVEGKLWMSQLEINFGTCEYREKWNQLINEVYEYLRDNLVPAEFEELKQDEVLWIEEKERYIEEVGKQFEGGSAQLAAMSLAEIKYTSERVYYLISLIADVESKNSVLVIMNNEELTFTQPPVIENGTTLVPMRAIFGNLGAEVNWDGTTKTVTSTKDGTTVMLTIDSTAATVNGETVLLSVPAKLVNGNTMVPLRFVSESLGAEVNWDGNTKTVTINS